MATLVGQRVFGIASGFEDFNDHDDPRHDPLMSGLAGKLKAWRADCAPVSGKYTTNRLELSRATLTKYRKIARDPATIEALFVNLFIEAHAQADHPRPRRHRRSRAWRPGGRFFDGCYCYLPLYVYCGRHSLAAKLRPSDIDGAAGATQEIARIVTQIWARWPRVRSLLRGDSGFCREDLMVWCKASYVDFLFGLAGNSRLVGEIGA